MTLEEQRSGEVADMAAPTTLTRASFKTPKAAAVAGIIFSTLLIGIFWLFRASVPADPTAPGAWLYSNRSSIALALNLVPIAGVAFLWFIGVLRDRLGELEDRFFATIFFGSGVLFLALLFSAAAIIGALIVTAEADGSQAIVDSAVLHFGRAIAHTVVNVYLMKMCVVFMFSTSVIALRTGLASRWLGFAGLVLALAIILFGSLFDGALFAFPLWALVLNANLLARQQSASIA